MPDEKKTPVTEPVPAKPLAPGEPDPAAMKPKETIPGGLTVNAEGHYVNANNEYVDRTGKKSEKPVKAGKDEDPVGDYLKAQEKKEKSDAE